MRATGVTVAGAHLKLGRPADVIADLAEQLDAGLIVAGSRGAGALPRLLLGSVSEGLVHISNRPVLVVRSVNGGWPPQAVLAGDDGSDQAAAACAAASDIAGLLHAPFKVMMAYPRRLAVAQGLPPAVRGVLAQLEEALDRRARAAHATATAMRQGDPAEALLEEAAGPETLVVVGTHGAGAISRMALGSVSTAVLHAHRGAVLVVPGRLLLPQPDRRKNDKRKDRKE